MQEGLEVLTDKPAGRSEPYLKPDKLIDPWGEPYKYEVPGPSGAYLVLSYGSDKQPGGEAGTDAADITSDNLRDTDGGGS
jgi:general secretion pathway protein G